MNSRRSPRKLAGVQILQIIGTGQPVRLRGDGSRQGVHPDLLWQGRSDTTYADGARDSKKTARGEFEKPTEPASLCGTGSLGNRSGLILQLLRILIRWRHNPTPSLRTTYGQQRTLAPPIPHAPASSPGRGCERAAGFDESEAAYLLASTYRRLGKLFEARNQRAGAIDYYNKFVELWSDADPALQVGGGCERIVGGARQRIRKRGPGELRRSQLLPMSYWLLNR